MGDAMREGGEVGGGGNSNGGGMGGRPDMTADAGRDVGGGELAGVCVGEMTSPGLA